MQTLTDGYVNVNAVVLLQVDIVMHSINFKLWMFYQKKKSIKKYFGDLSSSTEFFLPVVCPNRHSEILAEHFIVERFQSLRVLHGRWQCKGTTQVSECCVSVAICWVFVPLGFPTSRGWKVCIQIQSFPKFRVNDMFMYICVCIHMYKDN